MPFYQELGRHTPPPPPYSLGRRNSDSTKSTYEASQRSDPPPPSPYSNSSPKIEFKMPSIYELEQTMASDKSYSPNNGNATPLPPVPFQISVAQTSNPRQGLEDYPRDQICESIPFGIPVEPKLVPSFHGHTLRPLTKLPLDGGSHSAPQQNSGHNQGAGLIPDHDTFTSRSLSTVSLDENIASCAARASPHTLPAVDQQPLPTSRRHSSRYITSIINPMTLDTPAPFEPSGTMCPLSALPSQQVTERRATLATVPTSQQYNTVGKVSDIQSLLEVNPDSSFNRNLNNWYGGDTRETTRPKDHDHASPAPLAELSQHCTSHGREKAHRVSNPSHRRPLASVRFDPYKRRQSRVAEQTEQGLGGAVDKKRAKSSEADSDVDMDEGEEEVERRY